MEDLPEIIGQATVLVNGNLAIVVLGSLYNADVVDCRCLERRDFEIQ